MNTQSVEKENIIIIGITGSLDINSHTDFYDDFISQLNKPVKKICINFEEVDFIDSSGISILVKCLSEAKNRAKEMILFGIKQEIMNNLEIIRLDNFFNIKTREEIQKYILDN